MIVHPMRRFAYRIRPLSRYGQPSLATNAGKMLQNAIIPLGVEGGTRSRAAERMITYSTANSQIQSLRPQPKSERVERKHTIIDQSKEKEGSPELEQESADS